MAEHVCPVWMGYVLAQTQGFVVTGHPRIRLSQTAALIKPSVVGE